MEPLAEIVGMERTCVAKASNESSWVNMAGGIRSSAAFCFTETPSGRMGLPMLGHSDTVLVTRRSEVVTKVEEEERSDQTQANRTRNRKGSKPGRPSQQARARTRVKRRKLHGGLSLVGTDRQNGCPPPPTNAGGGPALLSMQVMYSKVCSS